MAIAWICTIGALGYGVLGFVNLGYVGMERHAAEFKLVAPALMAAAVIHLYLVTKGTRPPQD